MSLKDSIYYTTKAGGYTQICALLMEGVLGKIMHMSLAINNTGNGTCCHLKHTRETKCTIFLIILFSTIFLIFFICGHRIIGRGSWGRLFSTKPSAIIPARPEDKQLNLHQHHTLQRGASYSLGRVQCLFAEQ